jgi:hypothetical protein
MQCLHPCWAQFGLKSGSCNTVQMCPLVDYNLDSWLDFYFLILWLNEQPPTDILLTSRCNLTGFRLVELGGGLVRQLIAHPVFVSNSLLRYRT